MRIYAVADLHGKADRIEYMVWVMERHHPDVVVVAGDIAGWGRHRKCILQLNELPAPVLAVTGNGDGNKTMRLLESAANITHLHLKRTIIQGLAFCGVGGTIPIPFHSRLAWRESGLIEAMRNVLCRGDTLMAHSPPFGVQDRVLGRINGGSKGLRSLVETMGPRLVLCGHIHECAGYSYLGSALVINCNMAGRNGGVLVDLTDQQPIEVRMLKR